MLHIHVRDPLTGKISNNFKEYGEFIGRLREAVPKMILQVGGSISFSPPDDHSKAQWQGILAHDGGPASLEIQLIKKGLAQGWFKEQVGFCRFILLSKPIYHFP